MPVPVVPVVIEGAYEAWPRHKLLPRFRPIRVRICPAVDPRALPDSGAGATEQARLAHALRTHFMGLVEAKTLPPPKL
jgi:1-acyl-sn-glycerol-3-phosphate acyltransferase